MGKVLTDLTRDWGMGVITAMSPDELPPGASPRGINSILLRVAGGKAVPGKRPGCATINRTAITGSPAIIGQYEYKRLAAGVFTTYHLAVSNAGRLDVVGASSTAAADSGTPAPFTSGDHYPSFTTAENLCFIVNGQDRKKFNGTTVQGFGITRPTVGAMAGAAGAAGSPNGTYAVRCTYYNSATGHESSASDSMASNVTVASQKISLSSIPTSADSQVTGRKIYIRNTATMANFYLAATITDNSSTTATLDFLDASLTTLGPDTTENDPPPSGVRYLTWAHQRLFAADDTNLYYSNLGEPESFDPDNFEAISSQDSDKVTGIYFAHGVVMVFTRDKFYVFVGDNPDTWTLELVSADIGCTSHRSITSVDGVTRWWSEQGPVEWNGAGSPKLIGKVAIQPTIDIDALAYSQFDKVISAVDLTNQLVLFGVAELGTTRNTKVLPYSYRLSTWVSDHWDPFDIASMATVQDSSSDPYIFFGNYAGQVFKFDSGGGNDGIAGGTTTGTITSHTASVITVSGATFDTTGAGLIERTVVVYDSTFQNVQRFRITANAATTLTVSPDVSGDLTGYSFVVGAPWFEWDTRWVDYEVPFHKKRFEFVYAQIASTSAGGTVTMEVYLDNDESDPRRTEAITLSSSGLVWGQSLWGQAVWGSPGTVEVRRRVGATGKNVRLRFRNVHPTQQVTLLKAGSRAELLTDKS